MLMFCSSAALGVISASSMKYFCPCCVGRLARDGLGTPLVRQTISVSNTQSLLFSKLLLMFFNRERMLGGAVRAYETRPFLSKPIEPNLQMEAKRTPQCCYNALQVWFRQYTMYSKIEESYSGWIAYASAIQPLSTIPTL